MTGPPPAGCVQPSGYLAALCDAAIAVMDDPALVPGSVRSLEYACCVTPTLQPIPCNLDLQPLPCKLYCATPALQRLPFNLCLATLTLQLSLRPLPCKSYFAAPAVQPLPCNRCLATSTPQARLVPAGLLPLSLCSKQQAPPPSHPPRAEQLIWYGKTECLI